ncbi:MAG TPA: hypothetical protein DEV93_13215 [Chloroflexi bacterium]|nr:hypothetical protein [Chloroflexota bacterium]
MSAFMVGKQHIDLMVDATTYNVRHWPFSWYHEGTRHELLHGSSGETPRHNAGSVEYSTAAIGRMLIDENLRSIHARYPDTVDGGQVPGPFESYWEQPYSCPIMLPTVDAVQVLKAIDCYEYQSCEHDGWETSTARAFCDALRGAMIHRLPGYEEAQWDYAPR